MGAHVTKTSRHLLGGLVLLHFTAACGGFAAAQSASEEGLHVSSPPRVLNDPIVMRCRQFAARRMDPNVDAMSTVVEMAGYKFEIEPVFEAVAACRAALSIYPNEPKVIIAHYNASDVLTTFAL